MNHLNLIYKNTMTNKEFDLIKKILAIKGELDNYVILCEDEQGRYIKYAFIDGDALAHAAYNPLHSIGMHWASLHGLHCI